MTCLRNWTTRVAESRELLEPGSRAPDFTLEASGGRRVKLKELLALGPVALFFYPGNNTPG